MTDDDKMDLRIPKTTNTPKCRILYDVPCKVCRDHSSGKHYGIFACDGCAGFFKRSIRRNRQYICKAKSDSGCMVDKTHRNQCRACRLTKCLQAGMNKEAVQHERGPRNSTIRRQMSLYFKENGTSDSTSPPPSRVTTTPPSGLPNSAPATPAATTGATHTALPVALPFLSVNNGLPLPFSVYSTAEVKSSSPKQDAKPSGSLLPEIPRPDFRFFAFNRFSIFPSKPTNLLAPTPKYPHEIMAPFQYPHEIMAPFLHPESLCETAARSLFANVKWAKHLPAFSALPLADQLVLLEESWRELFVLSLSQLLIPLEIGTLLASAGVSGDNSERLIPLLHDIKIFQETMTKFKSLSLDSTEYACLKAIVIFKTNSEVKSLREGRSVTALQDQAQLTLNKYITTAYPTQPFRFGKLLLLLPSLRNVSGRLLEQVFFRNTIGIIPIERIICDMYKSPDF